MYNENRPILDEDFKISTNDLMNINSRFKISKIELMNTIHSPTNGIFYCNHNLPNMKGERNVRSISDSRSGRVSIRNLYS